MKTGITRKECPYYHGRGISFLYARSPFGRDIIIDRGLDYMSGLSERKVITSKGEITLPKHWRDAHGVEKGDTLQCLFGEVVVYRPTRVKLSPAKAKALARLLT